MITIENGGVEEIIPADQANKKYIVEVAGAPVRIGHTKRYAKDGTKLEPGRNHKVDNLRGERLFAAAVDAEAQLLINQAAADVDSQPSRDVTVLEGDVTISGSTDLDIEDRPAREIGKARVMDSDGVLIDPATETTLANVYAELQTQTTLLEQLQTQTTLLEQIEENTRS